MRQWGTHGEAEGEFNRAMAIALDDKGTVYVVDTANHRVQCFDAKGTLLRAIGEVGTAPGQLKFPHDIALAPDGSLSSVTLPGPLTTTDGQHVDFANNSQFLLLDEPLKPYTILRRLA